MIYWLYARDRVSRGYGPQGVVQLRHDFAWLNGGAVSAVPLGHSACLDAFHFLQSGNHLNTTK